MYLLINPKHVARTSERKYMMCMTEKQHFFSRKTQNIVRVPNLPTKELYK
jgi:hypothetical protein